MKISIQGPPECTILKYFSKFSWGSMPRDATGLDLHLLAVAGICTIKAAAVPLTFTIYWSLGPVSNLYLCQPPGQPLHMLLLYLVFIGMHGTLLQNVMQKVLFLPHQIT